MKIYAVDNEILALEIMEEAIKNVAPDEELKCFQKSRLLLEEAEKSMCDVAFLDVEMPGLNGLELAKELKKLNPNVNIIFATGYSEYMQDALNIFASGYVLKPVTEESVRNQLENLRHPVKNEHNIEVKTFGNFSITKDGQPIKFRLAKSKELLAYLIDRKGAVVSRRELSEVLLLNDEGDYSRNEQKNLGKILRWLMKDLESAEIDNLLLHEHDGFRVNTEEISCDLFDYLEDKNNVSYFGEYMEQYPWGNKFKNIMAENTD